MTYQPGDMNRTNREQDALTGGLRRLTIIKYGFAYPVVEHSPSKYHGDAPGLSRRFFLIRCRNAWTNGEHGLTDEIRQAYGIDPDEHHEIEREIFRPYRDGHDHRLSEELGTDPGHDWLYIHALGRVPTGMIPVAVLTHDGWVQLDGEQITRMMAVVRSEHDHPVHSAV